VGITHNAAVRICHARADFGVALLLGVWRFQVRRFWIVAFVFLGTIYANMKTLQYANVETFIVFRSSASPRARVARGLRSSPCGLFTATSAAEGRRKRKNTVSESSSHAHHTLNRSDAHGASPPSALFFNASRPSRNASRRHAVADRHLGLAVSR
jgi:hypothetical protein